MSQVTPRRLDDVIALAVLQTVLQVERQSRKVDIARIRKAAEMLRAVVARASA